MHMNKNNVDGTGSPSNEIVDFVQFLLRYDISFIC